jgi:MoxR-like ATPase
MDVHAAVDHFATDVARLETEIRRCIVGQTSVVEGVVTALLAGGHALLEGVPGIGKTALVRALAGALDLSFSRIQFTPDLMPTDITGTDILVEAEGPGPGHGLSRRFEFSPGPIFAEVVLADEINRATPKTQSALLEAMQERSVTVGRQTYSLAPAFLVLATQNPVELEGTYPLPEAQLDRFLWKLNVTVPTRAELGLILERTTGPREPAPEVVMGNDRVLEMRQLIREVPLAPTVKDYVVRLIEASQPASSTIDHVKRYVRYGSSPRGAQAIVQGAKVRALRHGRFSPSFEDVRHVAPAALRHRILLNFDGEVESVSTDALVARILESVPEEAR